jgi:hypothetical protein
MAAVAGRFTAGDQRGFRWYAVDQALLVRRVQPGLAREGLPGAGPGDATGSAIDATHEVVQVA